MTLAPGLAYCAVCDTPYPLDAAECPTCARPLGLNAVRLQVAEATQRDWQNEPPACPFCASEDTFLMGVWYGDPVWGCCNEQCPNEEHQRFFDLRDVEGTAKHD